MSFTKENIFKASGIYGDLKIEIAYVMPDGCYVIIKDKGKIKNPRMNPVNIDLTDGGLWNSIKDEEPLDLDGLRFLIQKNAIQNGYAIKDLGSERFEDGIASLLKRLAKNLYKKHHLEDLKGIESLEHPEYVPNI